MNPITDDELILYRYRDGLSERRIAEIDAVLALSPELRERYQAIEHAVAQFDDTAAEPDDALNDRLWRRLEPRLIEAGVIRTRTNWRERIAAWLAPRPPPRLAFAAAAALVIAIGAGYFAGRRSVTVAPEAAADAAAARVLDAYVAAHLRATEGVLLTASNSGNASLLDDNRRLAEALVESNRLYAAAAERAGNTQLASFLHQLEPVLLSLANQSDAATIQSSEDLRHFLNTTDLLFQVRATEARLDRGGRRT